MDNIGLDLHKRESQLCILSEEGEVVERRIRTSRERFTTVLGGRAPARVRASGWRSIWRRSGTP
jgi:transposase